MVVSIIGGGAVGGYLGSLLTEDVRIFEEHKKIGEPVQCAGLFTHNISKFVKLSEHIILNRIGMVRLTSPAGNTCEFDLKKKDVVVDRTKFDKYLIDKAVDNGAKLYLNHKFIDMRNEKIMFSNGRNYGFDKIVGADGPNSVVKKIFFGRDVLKKGKKKFLRGKGVQRRFWIGKQARIKMRNNSDMFEVDFSVPGFFGWVIPESEKIVRVGVASEKGVENEFEKFLKRKDVDRKGIMGIQTGIIPKYDSGIRLWDGNNAFLVGDAGGMVKALSGGGVVPGLRVARILSHVLNSDDGAYYNYEKIFRRSVGRNLFYNLKIRNFLDKLDEKDYDKLIFLLDKHGFNGFDREDFGLRDIFNFLSPELVWFVLKKMIFK